MTTQQSVPFFFDNDYFQKTYAGWLGKIIGIRMGSPIEGWPSEKIESTYGKINGYTKEYNDYAADDDSNGPLFFIRALFDYPESAVNGKGQEMAETWLNYVPAHHGFFWWGGYGISTENTAYDNLAAGIPAPRSGSIALNGKTCAEQIGGQIFIDSWGFVFPAAPQKAADAARRMIQVSHDGNALYGGMFIAACISAAYAARSVDKIIEKALSTIPSDCLYAKVVTDIRRFYHADAEKSWKNCFRYVQKNYGYDKFKGNCHIIPNAAVIILSLLYGNGSFRESLSICNTCGWDTDCNAGNTGAILGVLCGTDKIDDDLIRPIKDLLIASSVIGNLNITTVSASAQFFCSLACRQAHVPLPADWQDRDVTDGCVIHFDFKKSTGAFRSSDSCVQISNSEEPVVPGHRSLLLEKVKGKGFSIFYKTYYSPDDLEDSRYDPSFTPVVFPGQTISAVLKNTGNDTVSISLFASDKHTGETFVSSVKNIREGETTCISYQIPGGTDALIATVGLKIASESEDGQRILLDNLTISGKPDYKIDFSKEKVEYYKTGGAGIHRELGCCTVSKGLWDYEDGSLTGSCADTGELLTGYYYGKDYRYSCLVTPVSGEYHLINFRVQGLARSYAFGFYGENTVALLKKKVTYSILAEKEFIREEGKEYRFSVLVNGDCIKAYVDGTHVFEITDPAPYQYGQIGMTVSSGSRCRFRDVEIRPVN